METNFKGKFSAELNTRRMQLMCMEHIPGYDPNRFKILAIRAYSGQDFIVTVYAIDAFHQPLFGEPNAVKKFKIQGMHPAALMECIGSWNATLVDATHQEEDMVVINK